MRRNRCSRLILLCLFSLVVREAGAQQPVRFDRIGRSDGLSQSNVNCMLRDNDGFMWFGTQDGLNLYDGKKFRVFRSQPGDTNSLANNYILSMCEDEDGYIWAGTMTGGLNRFDKKNEKFSVFLHSETRNSISENTVWTVLSDGQGTIWAGTGKGLNRFDKRSGRFEVFRHHTSDSTTVASDMILSLYMSRQGELWAGTAGGLCRYDKDENRFARYNNPFDLEAEGSNTIWAIAETTKGEIIAGSNNGLYMLSEDGLFSRVMGMPDNAGAIAWSVVPQYDGVIWVGTDRGLIKLLPGNKPAKLFIHDPADNYSIADDNVWCLLDDPAGFLWAGTKNGISKTKYTSASFRLLGSDREESLHLSCPRVMAILEDRAGNLWIGTDGGGLHCIDKGKTRVVVFNSCGSQLRNDAVWALAEDPDGNIWIGNYGGGLHVWQRRSGTIKAFPVAGDNPKALANNRILALCVASDGSLWIGTRGGGLVNYNPVTETFLSFTHDPSDSTTISGNTVLSVAFDRDNRLWTGVFEGGLNLFIPESKSFKAFRKNTDDINTLSDDNVWSILFDTKGRMWLGTQGGLNYSTNTLHGVLTFDYFSANDGLNSNTILGLVEDNHGNIWMSSFNGLGRLNREVFRAKMLPDTEKQGFPDIQPLFRTYDVDNGLQGDEFNQGAYHKGHSGTIYFGGSKGMSFFEPDDVKESSYVPPVRITGLKVFNSEVQIRPDSPQIKPDKVRITNSGKAWTLPVSVSSVNHLVLSYRESVFSFEYASLDFSNPHKNRYAYKMAGFDEDWNYVGTQNSATYTNLNPGKYTFMVRGTNSDGIWNPSETKLGITIVPPFWQTWWFKFSATALLALVVFLAIKRSFRQHRFKAQKEKEFIELQLKTIKSQIDPHFAFNALNTIASMIYSEKPDVTYDYFTRFALMIRNILRDNEKISRTLHEEIDFVRNYLELQKIRFNEKFDYIIHIQDNIPSDLPVPKMIIQTYAENAVKHGLMHRKTGGKLSVSVTMDIKGCLFISITDNGIGREKAAELSTDSTRRGLKIIDTIIDLYRHLYETEISQKIEDLTDEKGNAAGTRALLTISNSTGKRGESPDRILPNKKQKA